MAKYKDLTGQRFGRLTVICKEENLKYGNMVWRCKCDCGNIIAISSNKLRTGNTKSCGCLNSELAKARFTTHGMFGTRIYRTWANMKRRCYNPKAKEYKYYGARGIKVCPEWHDFKSFYEWAMSNGYAENLSIDRIDNNGNYEPSNCQWITMAENRAKQWRDKKCKAI